MPEATHRGHTPSHPRQSWLAEEYGKYVTPRGDTDRMPEATLTKVHQGFSYLLDPTPAQRALLASHTGASRFCHNFLLGPVLANWKENRERKEAGESVGRTRTKR